MKVTVFRAFENPTIEELEALLKEKLGDKYTYKSSRKATSLAGKLIDSRAKDSVTVIRNAYHRTVVSIETVDDTSLATGKRTSVYFSEATLAGWLGFLHKEAGFIGRIIIRIIYGVSDEIYDEVKSTVKTNIKGENETHEVGLGALFKKKKQA